MRLSALVTAVLTLGCGAAVRVPSAAPDPTRHALVEQLCAPLPHRAFDCTVGWPSSVPPGRRDALASASGGASWASVPGVRAFALCSDRPGEAGPVSNVVTLLLDTSAGTPEAITERLPVGVRWTEACTGTAADCASYYARAEGDRVVLTRRVQRPMETDEDVAQLACAAVADGAAEAHVRIDGYGALVQALEIEPAGVTTTRRRPGRGETDRSRRTWRELELDVLDDHLEHESDVRAEAMGRAMDPDDVDVANETVLELQLQARQRRLARDRSPEACGAFARLAERGFEAHPSRPDLAILAIELFTEAGEAPSARHVLTSLADVLGPEAVETRRLDLITAIAARDVTALVPQLRREAPGLSAAEATSAATDLVRALARAPMERATLEAVPSAARALLFALGASHPPATSRAHATLPVRGIAWALEALGAAPITAVAVCPGPALESAITRTTTSRGVVLTLAAGAACVAVTLPSGASLELGAAIDALTAHAERRVTLVLETDAHVVSAVVGQLDEHGALRVERRTRDLGTDAELERLAREVIVPLDALGTRVFPTPTLRVPVPPSRQQAALAATFAIEEVDCGVEGSGIACDLDRRASAQRLLDAAYAMFRAR